MKCLIMYSYRHTCIHNQASFMSVVLKLVMCKTANCDITVHYLDLSYSIHFKEYVECLDKGDLSDNTVPEHEFSKISDRVSYCILINKLGCQNKKEGPVMNS